MAVRWDVASNSWVDDGAPASGNPGTPTTQWDPNTGTYKSNTPYGAQYPLYGLSQSQLYPTGPNPNTNLPPSGIPGQALTQQGTNITQNAGTNSAILQQLWQSQGNFFDGQNQILNDSSALAGQSQNWANNLAGLDAGLAGASWGSAQTANGQDQQTLGQYTSALGQLSGMSMGNYGQLASSLGSIPVLTAGGYGAPVISQAATAQADPASIAAQNQALGMLQSYASGAHDLQSQAAGAYANAQDVANQNMAAGKLQAIANGSLNVQNGQGDPEAYAAAHSALNQLSALTTPQMTAAEQFILEKNRLAQEQQESSNRAAVMTDLRRRGMSGSGQEIGMNALAGAQNSENRLLGDLGAQAQAVDRSMQALGGYANLSSAMNAQGNQVSEFNSGMQANAQQAASQAYATLRAQGFSEEYARRAAADQMAQFNNTQDLNAANMSGNLASNMRSQSFNEDFSRKSASDQVAEFNKAQSLQQQRFQDDFAAGQQQALTNRDIAINNAGNTAIGQITHNTDNLAAAQFGVTDAANQRNQSSIGTIGNMGAQVVGAQQSAINTGLGVNEQRLGTAAGQLSAMTNLGGAIISNGNQQTQLNNNNLDKWIGLSTGNIATNEALAEKQKQEASNIWDKPLFHINV